MAAIRPYRPTDRSAIGEVCVRTGDAGEDARARYPDPDLLPSIFAWPYLEFEPQLAFVLDDAGTAVGYVLGTANSEAFVERVRQEWLPRLAPRYPRPSGPPATPTDRMIGLLHEPERMLVPHVVADHPAHLHIDILPDYQGAGYGRGLMTEFLRALGRAGVPRVHLGVDVRNTRARAFYDRLGFYEIPVDMPGVTFMGRATLP